MANCVDPSSTDKGAANETDEVELQVLCLTGEGVTFSVSRSMLVDVVQEMDTLPKNPLSSRMQGCHFVEIIFGQTHRIARRGSLAGLKKTTLRGT